MRTYLALSCLQTRTMQNAWEELTVLAPDGIQLTPGCVPTPGFRRVVETSGVPVSFHHGFSWTQYRTDVWGEDATRVIELGERSVHPPKVPEGGVWFLPWLEYAMEQRDLVYETMYPGYWLGSDLELRTAIAYRMPLAVDVSHLYIQLCQGAINTSTVEMVFKYDNVREIHVSANQGKRDSHLPITADTFGLAWARERSSTTPVVLECYMHKLSLDERRRQIDILKGGT